jgi:hypothetical protein
MNNIKINNEEIVILFDALNLLKAEAKNNLEDDNIAPVVRELERIVEVSDDILERIEIIYNGNEE